MTGLLHRHPSASDLGSEAAPSLGGCALRRLRPQGLGLPLRPVEGNFLWRWQRRLLVGDRLRPPRPGMCLGWCPRRLIWRSFGRHTRLRRTLLRLAPLRRLCTEGSRMKSRSAWPTPLWLRPGALSSRRLRTSSLLRLPLPRLLLVPRQPVAAPVVAAVTVVGASRLPRRGPGTRRHVRRGPAPLLGLRWGHLPRARWEQWWGHLPRVRSVLRWGHLPRAGRQERVLQGYLPRLAISARQSGGAFVVRTP